MSKHKTHLIIGNSAAALSAIKAMRKMGDSGPIILISAEDCNAYSPVLTTYYIGGQIQRSDLFLVDEQFYRKFDVRRLLGRKAVHIDLVKRLVHLDNRSKVTYEDLLIATGASARRLNSVEPDAAEYVTTLRTLRDADRIITRAEGAKEIVFVGAGLVSLQTLKAVLDRGAKVTLVVGSYQVLSQQLDTEAAAIIQKKLEVEGVTILLGRGVDRVVRMGDHVQLITSFGETLPADLVIVGKGVHPNTDVAKNTEIRIGLGIFVDDQMRTNVEDVYAAGDVAEGKNSITGQMEVIATWSNACAQGEIAGLNMAGYPAKCRGQFRDNVTTLLGVAAVSMGLYKTEEGEFKELRYVDEEGAVYRKLFLDGSRLVGALLLGRITDAGVIRHCIANNLDVSAWEDRVAMSPLDFGHILLGRDFSMPFFRT